MQRKYYFGNNEQDCAKTTENGEEEDNSGNLDDMSGSLLLEEECTSPKMPVVQVSSNIGHCKPLDSIVELNYEASSGEELLI